MTTQNTPDTRSIVERKLSEIYTHITIPIPYEFYERYVEEAYDRLINYEVDIDKCTIAEHPEMINGFDREIRSWITEIDYDELSYSPTPSTERIFKDELREATRLKEIRRKEEEKKRLEAEAAQRKLEESLLEQIPVTKRNHAKALAILRAAGLTK